METKETQDQTKQEILTLLNKVKREGIGDLIDYLEESDYFQAPASTRFHANHKGGLAEHSLNVYCLFKEKNEKFKLNLSKETIIICSLLHDMCKVGIYFERKLKSGCLASIPYELEEDLPLGHSTKSIFMTNKFIQLSFEESLIIRWHMSWSDYEFKKHINRVKEMAPAIMAFITSDLEASSYLD